MVWFYKNRALFSRVFPSGSPMDEQSNLNISLYFFYFKLKIEIK